MLQKCKKSLTSEPREINTAGRRGVRALWAIDHAPSNDVLLVMRVHRPLVCWRRAPAPVPDPIKFLSQIKKWLGKCVSVGWRGREAMERGRWHSGTQPNTYVNSSLPAPHLGSQADATQPTPFTTTPCHCGLGGLSKLAVSRNH